MKCWSMLLLCLVFLAGSSQVWAGTERVIMDIGGMECIICALNIKIGLAEVDGVKKVDVSFEKKKAWLEVEDTVTDTQLVEAMERIGSFSATVRSREEIQDQQE